MGLEAALQEAKAPFVWISSKYSHFYFVFHGRRRVLVFNDYHLTIFSMMLD